MIRTASILLMCLLLLTACKRPRSGALSEAEKTRIMWLADSWLDTEEKYHQLGELLSKAFEEALGLGDEQMAGYLADFYAVHSDAITRLSQEIDGWQRTMTHNERSAFVMRASVKPYAAQLKKQEQQFLQRSAAKPEWRKPYREIMRALELRK